MKTKLGSAMSLTMLASLFFFGVSIAGICPVPPCVTTKDLVNDAVNGAKIRNGQVRSSDIRNGTIQNRDIAAAAAIAATKISGDVGIDFTLPTTFTSIPIGDYAMKNMASVTVTAPASGYVVVVLTGYCVFFADNTEIEVGVGTNTTAFTRSVRLGDLDGSLTNRFEIPYTIMDVVSVGAGSRTFYALAQGNSVFDGDLVNVVPRSLVAIFIPKRY